MKNMNFNFSIVRPVRFLVVVSACVLMLFSNVVPAFGINAPQSKPQDTTTQLLDIQKQTDKISTKAPPGLKETQEKTSQGGLNVVQGTADIEKMKRPENSQNATTVEDEVKSLLNKVTGQE